MNNSNDYTLGGASEPAAVKKNYNPLAGSEIKELIIRKALGNVEQQLRQVLSDDPNLTESLSFPKAIVEFRLRYDVHQWPQEENRHKRGEVWKRFQLDALPPDVDRILAGLPVPTAVRKTGAGLGGNELVVDEGQQPSAETKQLVAETFANRAQALEEDLGSAIVSIGVDPATPGGDSTASESTAEVPTAEPPLRPAVTVKLPTIPPKTAVNKPRGGA